MNPLVVKLLPYAVAALAVLAAIQMYGSKREAQGMVKAHVETADRLQKQLAVDSTANAAARAAAADSIVVLNKAVTVATVKQKIAQRQADSTATELRETLTETQRGQLDALTAAHARERAGWADEQKALVAKLGLLEADNARVQGENRDLRAINASLRAATSAGAVGHGASFVQRVSPYILAGVFAAKGVDLLVHK